MLVLAHALLIDATEDASLDILVMTQIALDCLPQKLRSRDALLPNRHIHLFKDLNRKIEQDRPLFGFGLSMGLPPSIYLYR
jgi:hypothetical protein